MRKKEEDDIIEEIEEKPSIRDAMKGQIGVATEDALVIAADLYTKWISERAENKFLKDLVTQIKYERDLFKSLWESELQKSDTSQALLLRALDKNDALTLRLIKDRMNMQDLIVKYTETRQTLVSLVAVIDELRKMIRRFVPQTELDRAEELIEFVKDAAEKLVKTASPIPIKIEEEKK